MTQLRTKPGYARMDPAHLFDGLFVPTNGKKRGRLFVAPRDFDGVNIGFQGFEQLGADDQSILLALAAQLGIDGLTIDATPPGEISRQLRLLLEFKDKDGNPLDTGEKLASRRTSLRSLLIDAGYGEIDSGKALKNARDSLNRLGNAQIRERTARGWDRRCNLISVAFNDITGEIHVAANPRLTQAVFNGQHVKVSLFERNELESEVAKILHAWMCSNVRLGQSLGNGNGAHIDTLAPHVWGQATTDASTKVKSNRRSLLRDALDEIADRTRRLHGGYGWAIDRTASGLVIVSRPKALPQAEKIFSAPAALEAASREHSERNFWDSAVAGDEMYRAHGVTPPASKSARTRRNPKRREGQCKPQAEPRSAEEQQWLNDPPRGRELL